MGPETSLRCVQLLCIMISNEGIYIYVSSVIAPPPPHACGRAASLEHGRPPVLIRNLIPLENGTTLEFSACVVIMEI